MIVFGTVVYLGALGYLEELIESINQQTIKDFDVLIINDDVEKTLLDSYLKKINNVNVYVVDRMQSGKTPAELRVDLLSEAKKKGYELLVIGDCDDTFASNRIEKVYDAFLENNNYGFYYNDLVLAESNDSIFSMPLETTAINDILQYNYLGMSNNAVNLRELSVEWMKH